MAEWNDVCLRLQSSDFRTLVANKGEWMSASDMRKGKGAREGKRRVSPVSSFLPSLARKLHRETSGNEAVLFHLPMSDYAVTCFLL